MAIRYLECVGLHNRDKRAGEITTTEINHIDGVIHIAEPSCPVFYNADFGVEALKDSIGTLGLEIVEYLNGIPCKHFSQFIYLVNCTVA